MPTDDQLRAYLEQLPPIYRDILAAYPELAPLRKFGQGLFAATFVDFFDAAWNEDGGMTRASRYDEDETLDALRQLEERRFLVTSPGLGTLNYAPTALGERLIALLTGHTPRSKGAPPLPQPAWA